MLTRSGRPFAGRGAVPSAAKLGPADGESRHARTADPGPVTPSLEDPVPDALESTDESGPTPGKVQADSTQISTYIYIYI